MCEASPPACASSTATTTRSPASPAAAGRTPAAGFLAGDGDGHLDLARAAAAGLAGGCFAVFTCPPPEDAYHDGSYFAAAPHGAAWREAMIQVGLLLRLERESGGRIRVARTAADLDGPGLAAVLHLEGAEPIGTRLEELELLHGAGMRSLGLTWSRPNAFATGVPFEFPGQPGRRPGPLRPRPRAGRGLQRAAASSSTSRT